MKVSKVTSENNVSVKDQSEDIMSVLVATDMLCKFLKKNNENII